MPVQGLLGKKVGMTQVYDEEGRVVPVTVVEAGPCTCLQVRTAERDGYIAAQLGFGQRKAKNVTRPLLGHYAKAGVEEPPRFIREVPFEGDADLDPGQQVTVNIFEPGERVKVVGTSKGRGFAGTIKRHGFARGPMTHGSRNVREPGSIGCAADPARVFKGRRMPGRMGGKRVTAKGVEVFRVDEEKNLLLLRGGIPGPNGGFVIVRKGY